MTMLSIVLYLYFVILFVGIMAVDAEAKLLLAKVVLAENHIGISLNFFRVSEDGFSGVVASKIIGSLHTIGCSDYADSNWKQDCQVGS